MDKEDLSRPSRRMFIKATVVAGGAVAAAPLLKTAETLATLETQELPIDQEIQKLREDLAEGSATRKWLELDHTDEQWAPFFKRLLRVTKAMEKAQWEGDSDISILKQNIVGASEIPNLYKISFLTEKNEFSLGNTYLVSYKGRTYAVTAKHVVEGTRAQKDERVTVLSDTVDLAVMPVKDVYGPTKDIAEPPRDAALEVVPGAYQEGRFDIFRTTIGEKDDRLNITTSVVLPFTSSLFRFTVRKMGKKLARDEFDHLMQFASRMELIIPPRYFSEKQLRSTRANGHSGELVLSRDMETNELVAVGSLLNGSRVQYSELEGRQMAGISRGNDLEAILEKAHLANKAPVSLLDDPNIRFKAVSRWLVKEADE